jgi:hypothetical protein
MIRVYHVESPSFSRNRRIHRVESRDCPVVARDGVDPQPIDKRTNPDVAKASEIISALCVPLTLTCCYLSVRSARFPHGCHNVTMCSASSLRSRSAMRRNAPNITARSSCVSSRSPAFTTSPPRSIKWHVRSRRCIIQSRLSVRRVLGRGGPEQDLFCEGLAYASFRRRLVGTMWKLVMTIYHLLVKVIL